MQSASGGGEPESLRNPRRRIERGDEYFKSKDFDRAIADYSEAIRIIENGRGFAFVMLAKAYHSRSLAYRQRSDLNSADADLREAVRIGYDNASIRFNENRLGIPYQLQTPKTEPDWIPVKRVSLSDALK